MLMPLPNIGKIIKTSRERRGLSQARLAEQIGLTTRQMSSIENGKSYPKYETLVALVETLQIPPDYLLGIRSEVPIDVAQFCEALRSCDEKNRSIVLETATTLINTLKKSKI